MMNDRPQLTIGLDSRIFKQYYYLKSELVIFCREVGLSTQGGKQKLTQRIAYFLDGGEKLSDSQTRKRGKITTEITLESVIEENIVCSEKLRDFFRQYIGRSFTFRVVFQKWLKAHAGYTFAEAIEAWYELQKQKQPTKIDEQFEYNTYVRAFFQDNPGKTLQEAIRCWNYKKLLPGKHCYEQGDTFIL